VDWLAWFNLNRTHDLAFGEEFSNSLFHKAPSPLVGESWKRGVNG